MYTLILIWTDRNIASRPKVEDEPGVSQGESLEAHGRFVTFRRGLGFACNQHEGMHRVIGKWNRLGFDCGPIE